MMGVWCWWLGGGGSVRDVGAGPILGTAFLLPYALAALRCMHCGVVCGGTGFLRYVLLHCCVVGWSVSGGWLWLGGGCTAWCLAGWWILSYMG